MKLCDLHTHSRFSDGTCSVEEILHKAEEMGLSAVALTDHNNVDGLESFLEKAKGLTVEAVPGIEVSTEYNDKELHVVALLVDRQHFSTAKEFFAIPKARKEESNIQLAKSLNENGYALDYEKIKNSVDGFPNRVHFAKELLKKGYVTSIEHAFDTILSQDYGFYKPPKRLTTFETIEFIKSINAVSVLAHPLLDLTESELFEFLEKAKPYGLDGMEVRYSSFTPKQSEWLEKLATKYGLLMSGGSDFHGENKPDISLGSGRGELEVPYEFLTKMKEKLGKNV